MTDSEDDGVTAGSVGFQGWNVGSLSSETSEEEDDPPQKKIKLDNENITQGYETQQEMNPENQNVTPKLSGIPNYNPLASKLMAKMGFQEGKGLGKNQQGRTGIIEASMQSGRRGLGHQVKGFEQDRELKWDFDIEKVSADETVDWMPSYTETIPETDTMLTWLKTGHKLDDVPLESEFCDDDIVRRVVDCKSVFDNLENEEMRKARTKSNPFETIRGGIFQNRAAMKMANMDAVLDFMFTNPRDQKGNPVLEPDEILYFADICAGPGGFSEYVLWRRKCTAKGFGFTLKGPCDFKLHEFYAAPSELFEPHYGSDDDGDIYKPQNLIAFRKFVESCTDGKGVHFVMADGGFSVEGMENLQEIKSNRLYLCQFLCALSILRNGGHFVCKLFDIFTNYSAGLIYLMYMAFEQISIFKPVTSRPANSERYIICKYKRPEAELVHDYMFEINLKFEDISGIMSKDDISDVVPLEVMKSNADFMDYIISSNEVLGEIQCLNLEKIQAFAKNPNLHDAKQAELRAECLRLWKVPDYVRAAPNKEDWDVKFRRLTGNTVIDKSTPLLTKDTIKSMHSRYDYKFVVLGANERVLILSAGRAQVAMMDSSNKWKKLMANNQEVKLELPNNTLLEAEIVQELKGEGKGQKKITTIHVIDALAIYGESLLHMPYEMRIARARVFCKAVTKITRTDLSLIRVKDQHDLCDYQQYFDGLEGRVLKGVGGQAKKCYRTSCDRYVVPRGLMIIRIVKDPWMLAQSRSSGKVYYFNAVTKKSVFEFPHDAVLSYAEYLKERLIWYHDDPHLNLPKGCVSEEELDKHIRSLPK